MQNEACHLDGTKDIDLCVYRNQTLPQQCLASGTYMKDAWLTVSTVPSVIAKVAYTWELNTHLSPCWWPNVFSSKL